MFSGIIRYPCAMVAAIAVLSGTAALSGGTAVADPNQDQKFFDLLGQKDIPPVDNATSLITSAHHICAKLDGGMPVGDLVNLIRNNGFNENPLTRLNPPDRVTRTITQFINASVEAYCPNDRGKIASITAYQPTRPGDSAYRVAAYKRDVGAPVAFHGVVLASLIEMVPSGEIGPTKPFPIPVQPPQAPQEVAPVPQQPPPPPRRVQAPPQQAPPQQAPQPAPQQAPPPEAPPPEAEPPPQAEPPPAAAPAPAPAPGGGAGGGNAPAPATPAPEPPSPPGHIRIAP